MARCTDATETASPPPPSAKPLAPSWPWRPNFTSGIRKPHPAGPWDASLILFLRLARQTPIPNRWSQHPTVEGVLEVRLEPEKPTSLELVVLAFAILAFVLTWVAIEALDRFGPPW